MSKKGEGASAPEQDVATLRIDDCAREWGSIEHGAQSRFAHSQRLLRSLSLGDVLNRHEDVFATVKHHWFGADAQPRSMFPTAYRSGKSLISLLDAQ